MIQFAADHLWLIPTLPLLACLLIGLLGSRLKGLAHIPAILAMICSFTLAISLLIGLNTGTEEFAKSLKDVHLFEWFTAGNFNVNVAVTVDQLTRSISRLSPASGC